MTIISRITTTKFSMTKALLSSLALLTLSACSNDQPESNVNSKLASSAAEITYVRNVEGIDEYTLSNGMKVLFYPDPAQPKTLVNITYRVGSIHENYGETGMAHLLEHMLFKGSTNYKEIDKEFNKRGMRVNASTWLDRTNYFELFESNEENLAWALAMEADRMVNATFSKTELDSEMTVVRNEMERGENSPFRMLSARMSSMAYLWHNYANSTIGARSDVENFPFSKLRKFYDKHYRPDNAVLTIAGRFDKDKTLAIIESTFGMLAKPATEIEKLYTVEPTQDGERIINLRRTGEVPVIAAQYHVPSALHEDTPALQVLVQLLSDNARGRMQKMLVEPGVASGTGAYSYLTKDPSSFTIIAQGFKGKDIKGMETALLALAEDIKTKKISDSEVEQAKVSILKETEDGLRNVTSVGMELSEFIAMGDYRYIFFFRDLVEKVTVEDVQRVAEQYLVESNRTLGRFIPTKEPVRAEITPAKDITEILATYKGREAIESGEVYDNNVENITARLQEFNWSAGTTLSVYPKKLRGGEVRIEMTLPTGNVDSLKGYEQDFKLMGGLLYSGNAKYSKEQIASKLDELKASVNISTNTVGNISVSIKAVKPQLDATLAFVHEMLATPLFEESEIDIDRNASVTGLESNRNEPASIALATLSESINGHPKGHPLAFKTLDQQIASLNKVTRKRLQKLHKAHMSVANGHIGVVGDVDPKALSTQLEQLFSDLKGSADYVEMKDAMKDVKGVDSWIETPDKANSTLFIGHRVKLNKQDSDYHAASVANAIFGGSGFASRLMQRIRVKEGYSYGTGSGLQLDFNEPYGLFYMRAIAAPENMKKVVVAYKEEVAKVVNDGFTQAEVTDAIAGEIKSLRVSWSNDGTIAGLLADNQQLNRDLTWYTQYVEKMNALTLDEVNAAFNKYIATKELNIFTAGDFAKSAEK
ncbi:peptidase M16 [Psychrosphaera saromensis]|nr:pitrilysin family protein [Psychrosphaera saromensis]GHB62081.1 peptidase M16 [Psychrosphaera saromensis]GLQ15382.1 peptidase M16 [Psychrosphaera saromensis]